MYRCQTNDICVFRRKTLHALRTDEVAAVVATFLKLFLMRHRTIKGEIIEDSQQAKTRRIMLRVSDDEYNKIEVLMEKNGYYTVSSLLRDLLFKKRIVSKKRVVRVTDDVLRDKLNQFIYQANKIGVNYNQFVATYKRQAKTVRPDGTPSVSTRFVEDKVDALMRLTQQLRDEVAVIIDIFDRYTKED